MVGNLKEQEDFILKQLLKKETNIFIMVNNYLNLLEEEYFNSALFYIESLKRKGYQLIDQCFKKEKLIDENLIAFYASMKVYDFKVQDYIKQFSWKAKISYLAEYNFQTRELSFNQEKLKEVENDNTINKYNYLIMESINHEIRHAYQYKLEKGLSLLKDKEIDFYALYDWIFFHLVKIKEPSLYEKYHDLFPFEYDAVLYSRKTLFEDFNKYFSFVPKHLIFERNYQTIKYIFQHNNNPLTNEKFFYRDYAYLMLRIHSRLLKDNKNIKSKIEEFSRSAKRFQDSEFKRLMRGDDSIYLDVIREFKEKEIKTLNVFAEILQYKEDSLE
ncbi:MAG: hypothetical protein ACOXZR_02440 [Bacilli bacterium]